MNSDQRHRQILTRQAHRVIITSEPISKKLRLTGEIKAELVQTLLAHRGRYHRVDLTTFQHLSSLLKPIQCRSGSRGIWLTQHRVYLLTNDLI